MSRRGVGAAFCFLATFLYILPNLLAAIISSGSAFQTYTFLLDKNIVQQFTEITVITLIIGIIYLLWAEISEFRKKK
ncbi:hypothetical protein [Paenibacillus tyrfis]|uniref:hypothetical protein n=1 Tax=Paenibacillus tyrfis TaxID=1501230 RepID=UPI000B591562|nr:hypothetical protein [Paenibacillus tyrfis]